MSIREVSSPDGAMSMRYALAELIRTYVPLKRFADYGTTLL